MFRVFLTHSREFKLLIFGYVSLNNTTLIFVSAGYSQRLISLAMPALQLKLQNLTTNIQKCASPHLHNMSGRSHNPQSLPSRHFEWDQVLSSNSSTREKLSEVCGTCEGWGRRRGPGAQRIAERKFGI